MYYSQLGLAIKDYSISTSYELCVAGQLQVSWTLLVVIHSVYSSIVALNAQMYITITSIPSKSLHLLQKIPMLGHFSL